MRRTLRRYRALAHAFAIGVRDGWEQPLELRSSRNVEFLMGATSPESDVMDVQDKGINIGQALRAGRHAQSWRERWWPFR